MSHDKHREKAVTVDVKAVEPLNTTRGGRGSRVLTVVVPLLAPDVLEGVHGEGGLWDRIGGENVGGNKPADSRDDKADEKVVDKDRPCNELGDTAKTFAESYSPGKTRDAH